jgi:hypothetical protein
MNRYLDTIPHPWTRSVIEHAIYISFTDAKASIDSTAGGKLWHDLNDLEDSLWIFETSTRDLLDEIVLFGERSKNSIFWEQINESQADLHNREVKKKLFYCTSSLMALVEHSRNFENEVPVKNYSDQLQKIFTTPGLHNFLQSLRNYNSHWRIARTNWVINRDFETRTRDAFFIISKDDLLAWDRWPKAAREFINKVESAVNVYEVFSTYRKQVQDFYAWHKGAVLKQYASLLQPYLEYERLYKGLMKQASWNILASYAPKKINPYQYIEKYLTKNQIERFLAYEHCSVEQIEGLISMMDMQDFCDASLKKKIVAIFCDELEDNASLKVVAEKPNEKIKSA